MNIIKHKAGEIYNTLQTKIFLFFAIIAIIISAIQYKSIIVISIQLILYYFIAEEIHCKIYGGCTISSWITTLIPIFGIIIFILDYFHIFKNIKTKIKYMHHKFEEISPEGKMNIIINNKKIPL
jgi:TRAP-type C4-dicarboxylate transport system permease small subunit